MPLYHLVGALDPLTDADIASRIDDGLPETLAEWIAADGLTHLKIKLNGDDLAWDVDRVRGGRAGGGRGPGRPRLHGSGTTRPTSTRSAPNVEYVLDFLATVERAIAAGASSALQYIEQPTHRDLRAQPREPHAPGRRRSSRW